MTPLRQFTAGWRAVSIIAIGISGTDRQEDAMAKGRDRPGKEKRKPKADKSKKKPGPMPAGPSPLNIGATPPPIKKM